MSAEIVAVIAALVALSQGLVKIIEVLVKRFKNGKNSNSLIQCYGVDEDIKDQIGKVFDIVSRTDDSGSFLVYVPRSLAENQKQIVQSLTKSNIQQDKTIYVLEKVVDKLERKNE